MPKNEHEDGLMSKKDKKLNTKQERRKPAFRCQWCNAPLEHAGFCDDDCADDYELSTFS